MRGIISFSKKTDCLRSKPLSFKVFLDNFHIGSFAKHFQLQVTHYVVTAKVKPEQKYY